MAREAIGWTVVPDPQWAWLMMRAAAKGRLAKKSALPVLAAELAPFFAPARGALSFEASNPTE
jgi:hypothetical protein